MAEDFVVNAEFRETQGKGASRRLRREGKVPAILYGGDKPPRMLAIPHNEVLKHLEVEAFYSHILTIKVGDVEQQAVLKDVQRHPAKPLILHLDFQRVTAGRKIHMNVPLHFINESTAPGVKAGGIVEHHAIDVEITCLPKDLPEYIEVDVGGLEIGDLLHLSQITPPPGVSFVALAQGDDPAIVGIIKPRVAEDSESEEGGEAAGTPSEGEKTED